MSDVDAAGHERTLALLEAEGAAHDTLLDLGFRDPSRVLKDLDDLVQPIGQVRLPDSLLDELPGAPDPDLALSNFDRLARSVFSKSDFYAELNARPETCALLVRLLGSSQYFSDILVRDPQYFSWLTETPERLSEVCDRACVDAEMDRALAPFDDSERRLDALRRLMRRELLRIGSADLVGGRPIHRVADELSDLADACLDRVIDETYGALVGRFGTPFEESGREASYAVIGLGKLGGQELNFSSDIDLMFLYSAEGKTDGKGSELRSVSNQEFFTRLSEQIVQVISEPTTEGAFFRVDVRLRPDGMAGALTMPLLAYESYYVRRGELWERQMLIKARVCAGDRVLGQRFIDRIRPFVFPGYIDGSPVDEIHRIKQRIEGKIGSRGQGETHLKLRSGGIRDVEFIVQCLQLIVGQVHEHTRSGHTLEAIEQLTTVGALSSTQSVSLSEAYVFYRRLEHRLQMMHGRSDYILPDSEPAQDALGRSLGLENAEAYVATLERHLSDVQTIYAEIFSEQDEAGAHRSVGALCEIELGDEEARGMLSELGFARPGEAHRNLVYLAFGHAPRIRGTQARRSFVELAPTLMASLQETVDPDQALSHLERLVSAYGAGNTLFQTLNSNHGLRDLLLKLCGGSQYLISILIRNPGLLDWLTLPAVLLREVSAEELETELDRVLEGVEEPSRAIAALCGVKNKELLRIGTRDLLGLTDSFETFEALTCLAEAILRRVLELTYRQRAERTGVPRTPDGDVSPFVILGLGKMGGRELNFGSDLDIVFVYGEDGTTDGARQEGNLQFFVAIAQAVTTALSEVTASGSLYEVDARLRPEGANALMALSFDAYERYLERRASTWERFALSRTRVVAGDADLGARMVSRLETFVLGDGLDEGARATMVDVRRRMERKGGSDLLSIKTGAGGIVDVEFIVQGLQIRHAKNQPGLRTANTRDGLSKLRQAGLIEVGEAHDLDENFVFLRTVEKVLRCQDEQGRTRLPDDEVALNKLARAVGEADHAALLAVLGSGMKRNRSLFVKYIGEPGGKGAGG